METLIKQMEELKKAIEAGGYDAAPGTLTQGSALQVEDLSTVLQNVCWNEKDIKLQKMIKSESCKSLLAQFTRQLSYGTFGGSAQLEAAIGQEETSQYARIVVPMAFYAHFRRVTVPSTMVATLDGKKSDQRAAEDAALKIAGDIEFDLYRGKADFSNAGVFDGHPDAIPAELPNMLGIDAQVRQADAQSNAKDLMFAEYGADLSVVENGGGTLTQETVENASVRSAMNHGSADKLLVDPLVLSAYNKLAYNKERIVLAGSAQEAHGADLRKQWVSGGVVSVEGSRFLSGKRRPAASRGTSPGAPSIGVVAQAAVSTSFLINEKYYWFVTGCNELGESVASAPTAQITIAATGNQVSFPITPGTGTTRYFNVYRCAAGGTVASAYFVGRVKNSGAGTTTFVDLNNRLPAFITGFLVQGDTMGMKELAPYSRQKLAQTDLSIPEVHFRFCCVAVYQPKKNVLVDNLIGSL